MTNQVENCCQQRHPLTRRFGERDINIICNLEQNKKEQLTPIPPMINTLRSINAPFWHHWNGGEEWSKCSTYFVQDCSLCEPTGYYGHWLLVLVTDSWVTFTVLSFWTKSEDFIFKSNRNVISVFFLILLSNFESNEQCVPLQIVAGRYITFIMSARRAHVDR